MLSPLRPGTGSPPPTRVHAAPSSLPPRPTAPAVPREQFTSSGPIQFRAADGTTLPTPGEGQTLLIGRDGQSQVKLKGDLVSRRHASLTTSQGRLRVRDEGSTNGTYLNRERLEAGRWYLVGPQDELTFASVTFKAQPAPTGPGAMAVGLAQSSAQATVGAAASAVGGPAGIGLSLAGLREFAGRTQLEPKANYLESIQAAGSLMGQTSGVVDLPRGVPTVLVSDIHARREFLVKVLDHEVNGEKVFDLLKQGRINLVCLGDGMHSEERGQARWQQAVREAVSGQPQEALKQEMVEGLGTMKMVMDLKREFGDHFHFLRGNHDEMNNPKREFYKYAAPIGEARLVREWVKDEMGPDFLEQYAAFEAQMPLVARGEGFVASHSAPGRALTHSEIEARSDRAYTALSWTENRGWMSDDSGKRQMFDGNLAELGVPGGRWFVGHRPVSDGLYRGQMDDHLIQINAPSDYVVAIVGPDGQFNPGNDVISL